MTLLSSQKPIHVKTFSLTVENWSSVRAELLLTGEPTEALESYVLKQLPDGSELIRWAVVRIDSEKDSILCEGAYQTASLNETKRASCSFADQIGL